MTWQIEELRRDHEHEWMNASMCLFLLDCISLKPDLAALSTLSLSLEVSALVNKFLTCYWISR